MLRKELKERFLGELTPAERLFFLNDAREALTAKGYRAGEDLFWYCFYRTIRGRLRKTASHGGEGYMRILLAQGNKEIEDAIRMYETRLEKGKGASSFPSAEKFIEYFSD